LYRFDIKQINEILAMHLSNIKLWNFRKFGNASELMPDSKAHLDLNFTSGLNVIIGENDSGKTAIIDAIKLVLKTHSYDYIKVDDDDFFEGTSRFRIELIFKGLDSEEAKHFTEWLSWEGTAPNVIPYLLLNYDVKRQGKKILPADVKAGIDHEGYQLTAEARDYLKSTYLKPLRDAESELIAKRNSRLSQILLGDAAFKGRESNHELLTIFQNLSTELKRYFKGEFQAIESDQDGNEQTTYPQHGKVIKDKIDKHIQSFYDPTYETGFDATGADLKSILERLSLSLLNEANPGLGSLNRLFMAAELLHLNKDNWTGLRLGLIEELEAHLHPQAQMQVIEALQKQHTIQLILTSHSPNLASKLNLKNLIICNNGNAFPMGHEYTMLAESDYVFLEKFLDTTKANLFFAKGIILVEGWAEEILVPSIARKMGINLTEKGVSIVNVGSLAYQRYADIFLRRAEPYMSIPIAVLTDSDIRHYEKISLVGNSSYTKRDITIISQETQVKISAIEAKARHNVKFFVAPQWTLEYCLHKSTSLGSLFEGETKAIHSQTNWLDFEAALAEKLINKGFKKTEIAYKTAIALDTDFAGNQPQIIIDPQDATDSIHYLLKAIEYAARV
jgi:putative ATP-dependent endonuclease of OLD family